jgi:hypothetical protein
MTSSVLTENEVPRICEPLPFALGHEQFSIYHPARWCMRRRGFPVPKSHPRRTCMLRRPWLWHHPRSRWFCAFSSLNSYKVSRLTPCIIASANTERNSLVRNAPLKLLKFVSMYHYPASIALPISNYASEDAHSPAKFNNSVRFSTFHNGPVQRLSRFAVDR